MMEDQHDGSKVPPEASHPLEVAAQSGYGPLSELTEKVWHGDSTPCVSCGMLNRRKEQFCEFCGQDLKEEMLNKMASHSGPWFVYDNFRPFPGVSLERLLLQIKRGALVRTSIVRGPTTFYQWRFATEVPIIAKYMGYCWHCQNDIEHSDERYCPICKAVLDGHFRADQLQASAPPLPGQVLAQTNATAELEDLSKAVSTAETPGNMAQMRKRGEKPLGIAPLVFLVVAIVVVLTGVIVVQMRRQGNGQTPLPTPVSETQSFYDEGASDIIPL